MFLYLIRHAQALGGFRRRGAGGRVKGPAARVGRLMGFLRVSLPPAPEGDLAQFARPSNT